MKYLGIIGIFGIIALCGVFLYLRNSQSQLPTNKTENFNYKEEKKIWHAYFDQGAPSEVYDRFLSTASALDYYAAHGLSHIIGEELYSRQSWNGITLCTQDFGFGCFHGFSGAALSDRGLDAADELSSACSNLTNGEYLGCIHGIGHGILAFVGNDSLGQALEACEPSQRNEVVGGCYGGVIMEYNYNTMQSESGIELREFKENEAYFPCESLNAHYQPACYYEQPSWWYASWEGLGSNEPKKIVKDMGRLCAGIDDSELRMYCFRGAGNVVGPRSEYSASRMREWCAMMPDSKSNDLCYSEALGHLLGTEKGKGEIRALCESGQVSFSSVCGPQ